MASAPVTTFNNIANAYSSQSLAASGTATFYLDLSAKIETILQVKNAGGGTVQAGAYVKIEVFAGLDDDATLANLIYGTDPMYGPFQLVTVQSVSKYKTIRLPWGKYKVVLTNMDTANAVTVEATTATWDSWS
ncbi:MAG: hypothetical protein IT437_08675 [Phycisphaerales bacterium]|nr:hypothetical protein [Phycisphaerales bacterium]